MQVHFCAAGRTDEFDRCKLDVNPAGVWDPACLIMADRADEFDRCELDAHFGAAGRADEFDCCELDANPADVWDSACLLAHCLSSQLRVSMKI